MRARLEGSAPRPIDAATSTPSLPDAKTPEVSKEAHPDGGVTVDWTKLELGGPMLRVRARVAALLGRARVDPALEQRAFANLEACTGPKRDAELELLAQAVGTKDARATFEAYVQLADHAKKHPYVFTREVRATIIGSLERGALDAEGLEELASRLTRISPMDGKRLEPLLALAGTVDGRTVMKTADVLEQRLQILKELGAGYGLSKVVEFATTIRGMNAEQARAKGDATELFRALQYSSVEMYEKSIEGVSPLDFVREELAKREVPRRSGLVDTFADVPSVKRCLRRIEELKANGSISEVAWGPYSPGSTSNWNARARRMQIFKGEILEVISTVAHELTHVPQLHFGYERGMTKEAFIAHNTKLMMQGEVQAFRVGAEMWRDFESFGVKREDIPKHHRDILEFLEAEGVSKNEKVRRLENYIAEELGYRENHRVALSEVWDKTVGAGKPELLEQELLRYEPPEQSRQGQSTSGRVAAPIDPATVAAAKATHGLDDAEAERFGRFAADLSRAKGMVESDPAAALREIFEAARSGPWKGLEVRPGTTMRVGEMTLKSLYREMVDYETPADMTGVELAYAFGVDEGAYRVENGAYRGTKDEVAVPGNVAIDTTELMPAPQYEALVKGLREQHAYGVISAFAQAASQRVRDGATIPVFAPAP